jgi:hypothetical protein
MKACPIVRTILFVASNLFLLSFQACKEHTNYESYDTCVIDFNQLPPPPFLGFEYWGTVGIILLVLALGLVVAAISLAEQNVTLDQTSK